MNEKEVTEKDGFSFYPMCKRSADQVERDCRDTSRQDALLVVVVLVICVCVLVSVRGG